MKTVRAAMCLLATLLASQSAFAFVVTDSRGEQELAAPATRVVALTWATAEQVIGLGETPLAIADVEGYKTWVRRPEMPEGVKDVGLRHEPNIEAIAALKPDLIIASDDQLELVPRLEQIAPVLYFDLFSEDHNNFEAARLAFLEVAKALGMKDEGESRLAALDDKILGLADDIARRFGDDRPRVAPIRFQSATAVRLYADNSMAGYALQAIGLEHAWPQPATAWGIAQKRIEDLAEIEEGTVLYIEPFVEAETLFSQPLWQFMPFVRSGDFASIDPTWTYGGPFSVGYLAEEIAEALVALADGHGTN